MKDRCGNTVHTNAGYLPPGEGFQCRKERGHDGWCRFSGPDTAQDLLDAAEAYARAGGFVTEYGALWWDPKEPEDEETGVVMRDLEAVLEELARREASHG